VRKDRLAGDEGGLAILVHHSIPHVHIDTSSLSILDPSLEILAIQIDSGSSCFEIFNVYLPPVSSCPAGHQPDFPYLLDFPKHNVFFFGDFNAHHSS
jgi:hypothetical protein